MGALVFDKNKKVLKILECELKKKNISVLSDSSLCDFINHLIFKHSIFIISKDELTSRCITPGFIFQKYQMSTPVFIYTYSDSKKSFVQAELHYIPELQEKKSKKDMSVILNVLEWFKETPLNSDEAVTLFCYGMKDWQGFDCFTDEEAEPFRKTRLERGYAGKKYISQQFLNTLSKNQVLLVKTLMKKRDGLSIDEIQHLFFGTEKRDSKQYIYNIMYNLKKLLKENFCGKYLLTKKDGVYKLMYSNESQNPCS